MTASLYDKETVIKTGNVSILDNGTTDPILKNSSKVDTGVRAYGEDDSVYLTVSLDDVDTTLQNQFGTRAITDVSGIYTGVQNVELTVEPSDYETNTKLEAHVYTAYDNNYYIIGAVVLAEAVGNTKNYAYVLGSVKSEEKIGDTYYWDFDAIVDGNVENLTLKSKYNTYKEYIYAGNVVDLRYDTDGYVIKIKAPQNVYGYTLAENAVATDGYNVYWIKSADAATLKGTLYLELEGRTLYITGIDNGKPVDGGLATAANARAFVIQYENGNKKVRTEYDSVADAFAHLEDPKLSTDSKEFNGVIAAVLNTNGSAAWIVFDRTIKTSNSSDNKPVPPVQDLVIDEKSGKVSVKYDSKGDKPSLNDVIDAITAWLEENRDMHDIEVVNDAGTYKFSGVDSHGYPMSGFEWNPSSDLASIDYVNLIIDDKVVESVPSGDPFTKLDISKYAKTGTSYKWTYGSDSDFYSITQKLSGMGRKNDVVIKTGYVEVNDTTNAATITPKPEDNKAKTKQYVKAGEVKFEFEADGTAYEIVYGEKTSVFYPVEKKNSITVNATGNITISESATVESITDTVKNIAEDKYGEEYKKDAYTINVDFEEKTVDIDILEGHSTSELKDTGLIVFAKQLLEKYDIIVCPDDGKGDITFKKGTDLTDTNNVATLKGLLPDAGRSKNITVKVTKNGDKSVSVDYIVSISVPSAV